MRELPQLKSETLGNQPLDSQAITKAYCLGASEWLSQLSLRLLISAQVTIPGLWVRAHFGLHTDSMEPAWDSFSLPLSAPLLLMLSFSVSKNK